MADGGDDGADAAAAKGDGSVGSGTGGGSGGGKIEGVPLGPREQARQALRRGRLRGGRAATGDAAQWRALLQPPEAPSATDELRGAARDAFALLDDTEPLLRVV